ncbi:MAG: hypothetical protein ATN35_04050 [Epulopiscium sp. Nele67-Bin004]|nr:MAG: hypothetical protein ATN35_04050 [Epulopiscium sp. Nele67-Bin004]
MHKQLKDFYKIALTYSSNALEGNSLTEIETKTLLIDGITVGHKTLRETYETLGHARAYEYMTTLLDSRQITEDNIKHLHKLFYYNIEENQAGVYRNTDKIIVGSQYKPTDAKNIFNDMNDLCIWIIQNRDSYHPIEFASLLHLKFMFIHPFVDGNSRIARLLMNMSLMQDGYLPVIIPHMLQDQYIESLDRGYTNPDEFVAFIRRECETQLEVNNL